MIVPAHDFPDTFLGFDLSWIKLCYIGFSLVVLLKGMTYMGRLLAISLDSNNNVIS